MNLGYKLINQMKLTRRKMYFHANLVIYFFTNPFNIRSSNAYELN